MSRGNPGHQHNSPDADLKLHTLGEPVTTSMLDLVCTHRPHLNVLSISEGNLRSHKQYHLLGSEVGFILCCVVLLNWAEGCQLRLYK